MAVRVKGVDSKKAGSKETVYSLKDFIEEAEHSRTSWPELDNNSIGITWVERVKKTHGLRDELARIGAWTMAGVLGTVTIYAVVSGSEQLLMTLVITASIFLARASFIHISRLRGDSDGTGRHERSELERARDYSDDS